MITKEDIQNKLDSIEAQCLEEYYRMPEFENSEVPVWDEYCQEVFRQFEESSDEEERQETLDRICVEGFAYYLTA